MSNDNDDNNNKNLVNTGGRPTFQIVWQHVHKEKTADDKWLATCNNCGAKLHYGNTKPQATKCSKHIIHCTSTPDEVKKAIVEASNSTELKEMAQDLGLIPRDVYAGLFEEDFGASGGPKKKKARRGGGGKSPKKNARKAPVSPEYRAAMELMSILEQEGVPITAYNKIMEWHLRHSKYAENKKTKSEEKPASATTTTTNNKQGEEGEGEGGGEAGSL